MRKSVLAAFAFLLGAGLLTGPAREAGAAISLEKCTLCHGKPEFRKLLVGGQIQELFVTADTLKGSVHEKKTCADCHFDVAEILIAAGADSKKGDDKGITPLAIAQRKKNPQMIALLSR